MKYEMKKKNKVLNNHNEWNVMKTHEGNENGYNGSRRTPSECLCKMKSESETTCISPSSATFTIGSNPSYIVYLL